MGRDCGVGEGGLVRSGAACYEEAVGKGGEGGEVMPERLGRMSRLPLMMC